LRKLQELAYIGRNERGEWGLALGTQAQNSMIDLIEMQFIPLYTMVGPFIFFVSLLLMVLGELRLVVTIFLRVTIILRYRGCGVWILATFWGTLFQLAVSPFNWMEKVMEEVGEKVGRMLNEKAYRGQNAGGLGEESTIEEAEKEIPLVDAIVTCSGDG
jgi:hypothetical protein